MNTVNERVEAGTQTLLGLIGSTHFNVENIEKEDPEFDFLAWLEVTLRENLSELVADEQKAGDAEREAANTK